MKNIKDEFLKEVFGKSCSLISTAIILYHKFDNSSGDVSKEFRLNKDYSNEEYENFLNSIDLQYDEDDDHYVIGGTVIMKDGTIFSKSLLTDYKSWESSVPKERLSKKKEVNSLNDPVFKDAMYNRSVYHARLIDEEIKRMKNNVVTNEPLRRPFTVDDFKKEKLAYYRNGSSPIEVKMIKTSINFRFISVRRDNFEALLHFEDGSCLSSPNAHTGDYDLMAEDKREWWLNVYDTRNGGNVSIDNHLYPSFDKAKNNANKSMIRVATIKVYEKGE